MIEALTITGSTPSGKSMIRTAVVRGRVMRFPNPKFKAWREAALAQLRHQRAGLTPIEIPVMLVVRYWPADRIRRDSTGVLDALFHVLENGGVLLNDWQVQALDYRQMDVDKVRPRLAVEIHVL